MVNPKTSEARPKLRQCGAFRTSGRLVDVHQTAAAPGLVHLYDLRSHFQAVALTLNSIALPPSTKATLSKGRRPGWYSVPVTLAMADATRS